MAVRAERLKSGDDPSALLAHIPNKEGFGFPGNPDKVFPPPRGPMEFCHHQRGSQQGDDDTSPWKRGLFPGATSSTQKSVWKSKRGDDEEQDAADQEERVFMGKLHPDIIPLITAAGGSGDVAAIFGAVSEAHSEAEHRLWQQQRSPTRSVDDNQRDDTETKPVLVHRRPSHQNRPGRRPNCGR